MRIIPYAGQDVCDMSPAWDTPEGISFSHEILWTIRFVFFVKNVFCMFHEIPFEKEVPSGGSQAGSLSDYRKAVLWIWQLRGGSRCFLHHLLVSLLLLGGTHSCLKPHATNSSAQILPTVPHMSLDRNIGLQKPGSRIKLYIHTLTLYRGNGQSWLRHYWLKKACFISLFKRKSTLFEPVLSEPVVSIVPVNTYTPNRHVLFEF